MNWTKLKMQYETNQRWLNLYLRCKRLFVNMIIDFNFYISFAWISLWIVSFALFSFIYSAYINLAFKWNKRNDFFSGSNRFLHFSLFLWRRIGPPRQRLQLSVHGSTLRRSGRSRCCFSFSETLCFLLQ
jgi:hypothetical protein